MSSLPPNGISAVAAHLQSQHGAQPAGPWRIRFRPHRRVHGTPGTEAPGEAHRRTLWEVTDTAHPQHVFVVSEDTSKPTRAEMARTGTHAPSSRWHARVMSAEFPTLLRLSNLPGPLGSAVGTPGPGAWVQRGAQVLLDGLSFHVRLRGLQAHGSALSAVGEHDECVLSIGNVVVGSDRIVGGMVEIQYLPLTQLPPDSSLLGSLLLTLLPPDFVPLLVPMAASLPLTLPTVVPRTMLPPSLLAEIVPASTGAWQQGAVTGAPGAPGFAPWDADDAVPDALGWTPLEARRRMAYVHLVLLRAEGLA